MVKRKHKMDQKVFFGTWPRLRMSRFSTFVFSFGIQGGSTTGRCSNPDDDDYVDDVSDDCDDGDDDGGNNGGVLHHRSIRS